MTIERRGPKDSYPTAVKEPVNVTLGSIPIGPMGGREASTEMAESLGPKSRMKRRV